MERPRSGLRRWSVARSGGGDALDTIVSMCSVISLHSCGLAVPSFKKIATMHTDAYNFCKRSHNSSIATAREGG